MRIKLLLVLLLSIFIISGCGNDQYSIERRYWYLQKKVQKIFINPESSPPKELARAVGLLNDFAKQYPKSNLGVSAEFSIAGLYIAKKEFSEARAQLQSIITKHKNADKVCSEALFLIGNSYELQDKWALALEQYKKLMQNYTITTKGLEIPIYIAQHYKAKYEPDKMIAALGEAISHYKAISAKYPATPLSFNMDMLAVQCYMEIKDWQSAVNTLNSMLTTYNGKANLEEILLSLAGIYDQDLNNPAKAIEILEILLKEYPKSKYANTAKELIKRLSAKKTK